MKILVISNMYPPDSAGGAEILTANLVDEWRKRHNVTVLTSKSVNQFPSHVIPSLRMWTPYPLPVKLNPVGYIVKGWSNYLATQKVIKQVDPDVVLVSDIERLSLAPLIAAQKLRPTATFLFGPDSIHPAEKKEGPMGSAKKLYNRLRFLTSPIRINYALTNSLSALRFPSDDLRIDHSQVVGMGVKTPDSLELTVNNHTNLSHRLIYLGQVNRDKGIHHIILALDELVHKHRTGDATLQIVGFINDQSYLDELRRLISRRNLTSHVTCVGAVSDQEKYRRLAESDLMVFAATRGKGHEQTFLEAMARGIACVCAATEEAKEVLVDNENCLMFEPGDVKGLVKAALRIYSDRDNTSRLVKNAREMALKVFTMERFAERCEAALVDCLNLSASPESASFRAFSQPDANILGRSMKS